MSFVLKENIVNTTFPSTMSMNATFFFDYNREGQPDIGYNDSSGTSSNILGELWYFMCNKSAPYTPGELGFGNKSNLQYVTELDPWADYELAWSTILVGVFLSFLSFFTIFGNILVMAAVILEPYLHTVTNYFIASLSTADFIVGAIVMPFCIILEVTGDYWPFGQDWCDGWHSTDVLACTASILNLCVIAVDRYWAITDFISYPTRMSPKRSGIIIAIVWICSCLISFPAIAWWRAKAKQPLPKYQCHFTEDVSYLLFSSAVSFFIPLFVMLTVYYKIYSVADEQDRSLKLGTKRVHHDLYGDFTLRMHIGGRHEDKSGENVENRNFSSRYHQEPTVRDQHRRAKPISLSKKISKLAKERRAAHTLAIVMGVFIFCWLPFFTLNVGKALYGPQYFDEQKPVFSVLTWLGWANSGMNPVIYAVLSRNFRRAYLKLLIPFCPRFIRKLFFTQRTKFHQVMVEEIPLPLLPPAPRDIQF